MLGQVQLSTLTSEPPRKRECFEDWWPTFQWILVQLSVNIFRTKTRHFYISVVKLFCQRILLQVSLAFVLGIFIYNYFSDENDWNGSAIDMQFSKRINIVIPDNEKASFYRICILFSNFRPIKQILARPSPAHKVSAFLPRTSCGQKQSVFKLPRQHQQ